MRISDVKLRTSMSTYSPHKLQLLVDEIPKPEEIVHRIREFTDGSVAYLGEKGGYVHFGIWEPKNQTGFAGSTVPILTKDGIRKFRGPWSSRPAIMYQIFRVASINVDITTEPDAFERGYTFYGGNVLIEVALDAISILRDKGVDCVLIPKEARGGVNQYEFDIGLYNCPTADSTDLCIGARHATSH